MQNNRANGDEQNLIEKVKKHGFVGSIKVALYHISRKANEIIYYLCWTFPVNEKRIVFESEGDLSDNAYALYEYMMKKGLLKKYGAVWLVDHVEDARKTGYENTVFVEKEPKTIQVVRSYYLATCRWYIYDHCNLLTTVHKRKNVKIVNLWHGCGFKGGKGNNLKEVSNPDYVTVTGKLFVDIQSEVFGYPKDIFLDLGYPRNDYLFNKLSQAQKRFKEKLNLANRNKILLWMPTFRKSDNDTLSENYFESKTGLPIVDTVEKLKEFNEYLATENSVCIFKLHHLQAKLNIFKEKYSNILIVRDEDIKEAGIQLYEFLPLTDCLISDYSSVTTDYMLLNRPILYTLDDYEEYRNSRGFVMEDPQKYFVGYHAKNLNEFKDCVHRMINEESILGEERKRVLPELHTYTEGNSCKRILSFLEIG